MRRGTLLVRVVVGHSELLFVPPLTQYLHVFLRLGNVSLLLSERVVLHLLINHSANTYVHCLVTQRLNLFPLRIITV